MNVQTPATLVALVSAATITLRAQSDSSGADTLCAQQGRFVGPCITVRGRMQAYSDNIVLGIWPIGTHRLLKVVEDPKVCALPRSLGTLLDAGNKIFADFVAGVKESDRKSTRLNSRHGRISYAVFCLQKKKREMGRAHV